MLWKNCQKRLQTWRLTLILARIQNSYMAYRGREGAHADLVMNDEDKAAVTLRLPSTLSTYSDGKSQIGLRANTVAEMLQQLAREYPRVWNYLCTEQGFIREHVKMFVNNEMVSGDRGLQTPLKSGQEVIVLPALPGL